MNTRAISEQLLTLGWDGHFPVSPWRMADRLVVRNRRLPEDGAAIHIAAQDDAVLAGDSQRLRFTPHDQCFEIAINADENAWRQRFGAMHGIASLFLGIVPLTWEALRRHDFRDDYGHIEAANRITLATLLPERYLRHLASTTPDMARLSEIFGVSPTTVRLRLKRLGLL